MMIGIGVIGAGRVSRAHARAAQALGRTRLAGVAEIDAGRRERFSGEYGCPGFEQFEELLGRPEVDAVIVALPHWLHERVTVDALQAGKHVLLEKPMAMTVAECDAILAAERASGRKLMVGHSQHFFPVNLAAQALLQAGGIGRIVFATDTWYKPFFGGTERPPWFLDATKGGGMWPMNGPHMIDRLRLMIDSEVVAVKAQVGNFVHGLPTTDTGMALLQFADGAYATIAHVGYRDGCGVERFEAEITGIEGQIKFDGRHLWRSREGRYEAEDVPVPSIADLAEGVPVSTFLLQMSVFADCILQDTEPPITGAFGREIVRVLDACEESSRTGREVRLD
jgi:phthalate 4,5-cis-dihydrodiol dehydrogenase